VFETSGLEKRDEASRLRKVRNALGKVAIRGAIREESSDERHDLSEVDPISKPNQRIVRHADVEQADATVRFDDSVEFVEERGEVHEIAKCKAAGHAIDTRVRHGKLQDVGLNPRGIASSSVQHSIGKINRDWRKTCFSEVDAHVTRATRQVEDDASFRQSERSEGDLPPTHVEPEGHDAVDEVIARGDLVEHVLHGSTLRVSL